MEPLTSDWPLPIVTLMVPSGLLVVDAPTSWLRLVTAASRSSSNWFGDWPVEAC